MRVRSFALLLTVVAVVAVAQNPPAGSQNVGAKLDHVTPRERHDAAEQN